MADSNNNFKGNSPLKYTVKESASVQDERLAWEKWKWNVKRQKIAQTETETESKRNGTEWKNDFTLDWIDSFYLLTESSWYG